MDTWRFWAYLLVFAGFALFTLFYLIGSPWRSTRPGRAVMLLVGTLDVVLINTLIQLAIPSWEGSEVVRVFVVIGALCSGWYLFYSLLREQRRGRRANTKRSDQVPSLHDRRTGRDRRAGS